jgi:hypothetical protein
VNARPDDYCTSPDAVAQVSNISLAVSDAQQRRIHREQGDVICLLDGTLGSHALKHRDFGKNGPLVRVLNVR